MQRNKLTCQAPDKDRGRRVGENHFETPCAMLIGVTRMFREMTRFRFLRSNRKNL
jgi:hypothetical protein